MDYERNRKNHLKKFELKIFKKPLKPMSNCRMNKKPQSRMRNFVQTLFSHSTLKLERKNLHCKTTRFSALTVSA